MYLLSLWYSEAEWRAIEWGTKQQVEAYVAHLYKTPKIHL